MFAAPRTIARLPYRARATPTADDNPTSPTHGANVTDRLGGPRPEALCVAQRVAAAGQPRDRMAADVNRRSGGAAGMEITMTASAASRSKADQRMRWTMI